MKKYRLQNTETLFSDVEYSKRIKVYIMGLCKIYVNELWKRRGMLMGIRLMWTRHGIHAPPVKIG